MSIKSSALQKRLDDTWTVQDLCERFGVTPMTVHLWRKPHAGSRKTRLPTVLLPGRSRPAIRFIPDDVREWAKLNEVYELSPAQMAERRREAAKAAREASKESEVVPLKRPARAVRQAQAAK